MSNPIVIEAKEGGEIPLQPRGIHQAVCAAVVDLGFRDNPFDDEKKHQIQFVWQFMVDGVKYNISKWYNYTLGKKSNLRKLYESWNDCVLENGINVDISAFEGRHCELQIIHEQKDSGPKAKVLMVMPPAEGKSYPEAWEDNYITTVRESAAKDIAADAPNSQDEAMANGNFDDGPAL